MKIMIKIIEFPRELMRSCMWSQLKLLSVVEFVRNSFKLKAVIYNHLVTTWFCNKLFNKELYVFFNFLNKLEVNQRQYHNKSTCTYFSERERRVVINKHPAGDYTYPVD